MTRNLRTGALDALRAMKGGSAPVSAAAARRPRCRRSLLACELARDLPSDDAYALLCGLLDSEPEPNVCAAGDRSARRGRRARSAAGPRALRGQVPRDGVSRILDQDHRRSDPLAAVHSHVGELAALTRGGVSPVVRFSLSTYRHGLHRSQALLRRTAGRSSAWPATGAGSFASYFARLRSDFEGEVEHFVNAFTVNETYFYREDHQLRCLTTDLLAERLRAKASGQAIRIWSVPCSTGEEPYSIAIWLLENWPLVDQYEIEIVGSDIDTGVLEKARSGIFGKRALMRLSPYLVEKYFAPAGPKHGKFSTTCATRCGSRA